MKKVLLLFSFVATILVSCSKHNDSVVTRPMIPTTPVTPPTPVHAGNFKVEKVESTSFKYCYKMCGSNQNDCVWHDWKQHKKVYVTFDDGHQDYYYAWPLRTDIIYKLPYGCDESGGYDYPMNGFIFNVSDTMQNKLESKYETIVAMKKGSSEITTGTLQAFPTDTLKSTVTGTLIIQKQDGTKYEAQTNAVMLYHVGQRVNMSE